ncbi:Helicase and polymerase-containing TEBICHI [Hyphodiscus hymeniophilus]|uniref:Helicase and polymerase-containing TEBICHI n=1 Tax=Hyphodiscus hymeniophilus TaxID=353542 RepID=A0A9P6VP52_9HELO|nr:Helicase and polymerase-containing TEBICHI [Hyphodiscus hymeniophilus]
MDFNKKSGIFHTTTFETAKITQANLSRAEHKRTFDEFQGKQNDTAREVFADITNRNDYKQPSLLENGYPALKAGNIYDSGDRAVSEYSQRRALALTPGSTLNPKLDLSHPAYGLSQGLVSNFSKLGIKSIYPWQSECLLRSGALDGERNLVYTAPTGGGKSLVADILMLKKVIDNPEAKALLVLPYVALVQEKLRWLRKVVEGITRNVPPSQNNHRTSLWRKRGDEDNVRVAGLFGGSKSKATWADMDIAVCTIEKANSLVNAAIDDCSVSKIGIVVIDELHVIDDDSRGYILELMGTKLLSLEQSVQIVGMSATLNNADVLARWLDNAKFYISKYRPVPVEEHLVFDNAAYPASTAKSFYKTATQLYDVTKTKPEPCRNIQPSPCKEFKNPLVNAVVSLANETARAGYGALVFCSSRAGCERDAVLISQVMPRIDEVDLKTLDRRKDLLNDLRSTSTGLDHVLEKTILAGVAFHHAGLTTEERDLIAISYDEGAIKVIVATCSLAAGINLPARRVILHGARMGADLVGPSMLRQMRGRAGRKGKDEIGETYLCCQKSDLEAVAELLESEIPSVESCLIPEKRGIKRALLEVIATRLATSIESLDDYIKRTLLYHTIEYPDLVKMVELTLEDLERSELIKKDSDEDFHATLLGQAIVASSLSPEDGLFVHRELRKALQAFVMDGEMHVLYSFTPIQAAHGDIDWQKFLKEVEKLDESNQRAFGFVGLKMTELNRMAKGGSMKENTPAAMDKARIYRRFYSALQLRDLCNEMPMHEVARKYDLPRGVVQNLAQTCHGFAAGMVKFCERMDWGALAAVLDHYSDRLKAAIGVGAKADLLALAEIRFIKSRTARVFWENGLKTVAAVAAADVKDLVPVLLQAQPRKVKLDSDEDKNFQEKLFRKAEIISDSANKIWGKQMQFKLDEEE